MGRRRDWMGPERRSLIFVACKHLGLTDDTRREIMERVTGAAHINELTRTGFDRLMDEFRDLGFVSTKRGDAFGGRDRPGMASPAQVSLIRALWREAMTDPTDQALDHFLDRRFKVSALRFLDAGKAPLVITGLKAMKARAVAPREAKS